MNATPFSTIKRRMISSRTKEVLPESRSLFVPKWLRGPVLTYLFVALVTIFSTVVFPAEDEPFLATVNNQNAFLRSGPGEDYYATNHVAVSQVLEVYYVIDDQWCAVRPPTGSFTWVDARNVRLDKNQVGTVLINGVSARVGSELGNSCGAVQVVLDRGEKVFVFERVETPNDIDTPVWFKIAPPAGEFRFIRLTELQFDHAPETVEQPRVLQTQSPIILAGGVQEQPSRSNSTVSRSGSSQLSSVYVPPHALPIPGASRNSGNAVANTAAANQAGRTVAGDTSTTTHNAQASTSADPGIDADDFQEVFGQLKLDLADALLEQETANETMQSLGHQARMLYQSAAGQKERAEAYQLITGIDRATRVRRHESDQNHSGDAVSQTYSQNNTPYDERYDRRVVQLPDVQDTDETQSSRNPTARDKLTEMGQRLVLPRFDTTNMTTLNPPEINSTPEPNYALPIERYSAQETFFDRSGRHITAQNNDEFYSGQYSDHRQYAEPSYGEYSDQQDFEIYLDQHGRYVDASGQVLDGQMLSAILHGADVVLMYDPQTGGYRQMTQHQLQNSWFPGAGRQPNASKKSWLQRLVSGELFQGEKLQAQQQGGTNYGQYSQYGHVPAGSGYAPHTYESAYGNAFGNAYGINAYAPMQQPQQQPSKRGLFATSQPSLIAQQHRNTNAMPGMSPNTMYPNNAPRGWQGQTGLQGQTDGMPSGGMIPQEITLPDGFQVPGEVVIYDESQGINLLGNSQNVSQPDQLALLLQQMSAPTMTDNSPIINSQAGFVTQQANLPLTEAESNMRAVQLRSAQQITQPNRNANHRVTGHLENGVGRVSANAFDEIGRLGRVKNTGDDLSLYALVDAGGKPICLVTPTPGVELGPYINQTVGITGIRGNYVLDGKTYRHYSAQAVYPIQGNRE